MRPSHKLKDGSNSNWAMASITRIESPPAPAIPPWRSVLNVALKILPHSPLRKIQAFSTEKSLELEVPLGAAFSVLE